MLNIIHAANHGRVHPSCVICVLLKPGALHEKQNYLFKAFKTVSLALLLATSLTACEFSSKEELIEAYGKTIGQDGYMTKDDYVIKWPAVYQGEVVAPPLTLKIPKKWLIVLELSASPYSKDREDGTIGSIYVISQVPGPLPWVEPFPWDNKDFNLIQMNRDAMADKPHSKEFLEKRARYAEAMRNSVPIGIFRGTSSISGLFNLNSYTISAPCGGLAIGQYSVEETGLGCMRETDLDGLESYVEITCYSQAQLSGVDQKHYDRELARKAADDKSPENCVMRRNHQVLRTPPNTSENEQVIINCDLTGCDASFSLYKRKVEVLIEGIYSKNTYGKTTKNPKNPIRSEVNTELPRWREKVDIARKLVNSFVVEQPKT